MGSIVNTAASLGFESKLQLRGEPPRFRTFSPSSRFSPWLELHVRLTYLYPLPSTL
jgi:hypothetical protein